MLIRWSLLTTIALLSDNYNLNVSSNNSIVQNMPPVVVFFLLINKGIYGLRTLSFENLKYVDKKNDYYFEGNFTAKVILPLENY